MSREAVISYPKGFENMIAIAECNGAGFWARHVPINLDRLRERAGDYSLYLLVEHNETRARLSLRPYTAEDLRHIVLESFAKNKIAVVVDISHDVLTYVYNHDGTLYLCTGLKEKE